MLKQVAEGVLVHESECIQSNAVVVEGNAGVLLVDPGITGAEMASSRMTFASWACPSWRASRRIPTGITCSGTRALGDAPRYGTARSAASMRDLLSNADWEDRVAEGLPPEIAEEIPMELFGLITGLPADAALIPWDGPDDPDHRASGARRGACGAPDRGTRGARRRRHALRRAGADARPRGAADPIEDYLAALQLFEGVAGEVDVVVPGHGSVGDADELRERIDLDRAYVLALRDGRDPDDPRIGPSAKPGWDWVATCTTGKPSTSPRSSGVARFGARIC